MDKMAEEKEKEKVINETQKTKLENTINAQKEELEKQKKELEKQKDELEKTKNELKEQNNQIDLQKKLFKKMENSNKITLFIVSHPAYLGTIKIRFEKMKTDSNAFSSFKDINGLYMELFSEVIDQDNKIVNLADKLIGQFLIKKEEIIEFFNFLSLLNEKISENKFVKCYYEAYKAMLLGPDWKDSNTSEDFDALDLFSNDPSSEIMKNILKFIVLLEMDKELKYHFFEAVLFYVSVFSKDDNECYNYFYLYANKDNIEKTVADFIRSFNKKLRETIIPKIK